ncbi:MAG: AAA family ATPase [Patescibacteria group bacterium]
MAKRKGGYKMPSKIWTPLDLDRRPAEIDQVEKIIRKSLVGQDRAVKQGLKIFNRMFSGIPPYDVKGHRPLGTFMFLGPTGVGKTLLAEEIARVVTGSPLGLTTINCAEFQEDHEIAKLIGSPPGYIGFNESGGDHLPVLSQKTIDAPYLAKLIEPKLLEISQRMDEARRLEDLQQRNSQVRLLQAEAENCKRLAYKRWPILSVVLFDEVEKASSALFKILLGIIDHGELRMGNGLDITYFNNSLIIFTGNIGSREISKSYGVKRIGFVSPKEKSHEEISGEIYDTVYGEMTKFFSPELIGRLRRNDAIIVFEPLASGEISAIVDVQMTKIQNRFTADFPIVIKFEAKDYILGRAKTTEYGARDIAGLMENKVFIPLCNLTASKEIMVGDEIRIRVDESGNNLVFERTPRGTVNFRTKTTKPKFFGLEG